MTPDVKRLRAQPNGWSCGPAALRHALLCYDETHSVRKLAQWCKTKRDGTDENGLATGCKKAGYELHEGSFFTPALARENVRAILRMGVPVVLCVDSYSHWVCAYRSTSRHLWIIDSAPSAKRPQRLTWREALRRMVSWRSVDEVQFDIYPIVRKK